MFLPRLVVLLAASFVCGLVQANTFGFSWDNDAFLGQDKNYTNGVRFSWVGDGQSDCQANGGLTCGVARALEQHPRIKVELAGIRTHWAARSTTSACPSSVRSR